MQEEILQRLKRVKVDCSTCNDRTTNTLETMCCKRFDKAAVPIDVARVGCDNWTFDEIPF